ncbi:MAG TPA: glycosyltransferase family 2 protein [Syntrophorhabdaceae bacterium]|jgi:hypothetical protein
MLHEDNRRNIAGNAALLSIIIITKDTKELLGDLLRSIEQDISLTPFLKQIVVVDNASSDGTEVMVRREFGSALFLRNETNMGFGASANSGFRKSTGELIFFLNSDTRLIKGELLKLVLFMRGNKSVGICGPQLVYPDMRLQRSWAEIPGPASEIIPKALRNLLFKKASKAGPEGKGRKPSASGEDASAGGAYDVESLIGAAILVRREAFEKVGGFDEKYFFFLEETDLCMRIGEAGFRLVLFSGARIIHLQGSTVRKNWVRGRIEYNISMYKFIRTHYPPFQYRTFQAVRFIKAAVFLLVLTCVPFLLLGKRTRRTYRYYSALVGWHLSGCPDDAGLRKKEQGETMG